MRVMVVFLIAMMWSILGFGRESYLFSYVNTKQEVYSPRDVVYLLPSQRYFTSYNVHVPSMSEGKSALVFLQAPALPLVVNNEQEGAITWHGTVNANQESYFGAEATSNGFSSHWFSMAPRKNYWLGDVSFINYLSVGDSVQYEFNSVCISLSGDREFKDGHKRTIKCVDRIRGDVNGDGIVSAVDVSILEAALKADTFMYYSFTPYGINVFAGCVLGSEPDFASLELIRDWVKNPKDPHLRGLGIGKPMSQVEPLKSGETFEGSAIFPNPCADFISVKTDKVEEAVLLDLSGKVVSSCFLEPGFNQISVEMLEPGAYILRLEEGKQFKLIKK